MSQVCTFISTTDAEGRRVWKRNDGLEFDELTFDPEQVEVGTRFDVPEALIDPDDVQDAIARRAEIDRRGAHQQEA